MRPRTSAFSDTPSARPERSRASQYLVRSLPAAIALAGFVICLTAAETRAAISRSSVIDGPSAEILEVGGSALAVDGTGGVVYLKREAGRAHVFASQFRGGRWRPPQRVDVGQQFDSSWPRIAAGEGGRLVVVWAQEFGPNTDRLYAAALDPGATRFEQPSAIDLNIREASATFPSVAMNSNGSAFVAYRVVTIGPAEPAVGKPAGYVQAEVRLARYNGLTWSSLGRVNRNSATFVREPNEGNSPKVAITEEGAGIVAFQEPDDDFVDRIWARRIFGSSTGVPLLASPQTFAGARLGGPADQFALSASGFGQATVVTRQQPGGEGVLGGPRVFVDSLPERFVDDAGKFRGPRLADGSGGGTVGSTSVGSSPDGTFLVAFGVGGETRLTAGDDGGIEQPQRVGASSVAGDPLVTLGSELAGAAAWRLGGGGRAGVGVLDRPRRGRARSGVVAAPAGGVVQELRLGGSGLGDALIAFRQGGTSGGQVAAAYVDAAPAPFEVVTPIPFVSPRRARISWDAAPDSIGGVRYSAVLEGHVEARQIDRRRYKFKPEALEDGVYDVQVIATDAAGQRTISEASNLKIDGTPPRATVRVRTAGRVQVALVDKRKRRRSSGPARAGATISFGDGHKVRRRVRASHRYKRSGNYRIVIRGKDRAGNSTRAVRRVRVRL